MNLSLLNIRGLLGEIYLQYYYCFYKIIIYVKKSITYSLELSHLNL